MDFAIIAAGKGSRLLSEGEVQPKPLVRIGGKTMIDRLISAFVKCGCRSVSIVINEDMPEVKDYLLNLDEPVAINVIEKTTEGSLESFHALKDYLKAEKFCLSTVDAVFDEAEFERYIHEFENDEDDDGLMAVTSFVDDEIPLYVEDNADGYITKFSDEPWEGFRLVSGGIYALNRRSLSVLEECINNGITDMRDYQRKLVEKGLRLKACEFEKIVDVDHVSDIVTANEFVAEVERHKK